MKRILLFVGALLLASACAPHRIAAQTIVQTTPQSTQQIVFNAVNTPQISGVVRNVGQNVHFITYTTVGALSAGTRIRLRIEATSDGTNWFPISEDVTDHPNGAAYAVGFYPAVRVNLVDFASLTSITVRYAGTSSTVPVAQGLINAAQAQRKFLFSDVAASSTQNLTINLPFGNTAGFIILSYVGGVPLGAANITIGAQLGPNSGSPGVTLVGRSLATFGTFQIFSVPAQPAVQGTVAYVGNTSTGTVSGVWVLTPTVAPQMVISGSATVNRETSESEFVCNLKQNISLTAGGDTQIITFALERSIRICHISFALDAAVDVKLTSGTGVNCATATADQTGLYQNISAIGLDFGNKSALRFPASTAACINLSGAATGGGVVIYAQF